MEKCLYYIAGRVHFVGNVHPIGAVPGKVDANSTDTYGVGAFLLTGSQLYKYLVK